MAVPLPGTRWRRHHGDHHAQHWATSSSSCTTSRPRSPPELRGPRRGGLLRRHDVPPGRAGLRHPGRRPARATGRGGPGYTIPDETVVGQYGRGVVAMARTCQPNSQGSQFFIVIDDRARPALEQYRTYVIFGEVVSGMDVVDQIAALPNSGPPNNTAIDPVVMTSVTVQAPRPDARCRPRHRRRRPRPRRRPPRHPRRRRRPRRSSHRHPRRAATTSRDTVPVPASSGTAGVTALSNRTRHAATLRKVNRQAMLGG